MILTERGARMVIKTGIILMGLIVALVITAFALLPVFLEIP